MLMTLSGPPGSGTSTVATAVADAVDHEHISGGEIFRGIARDRGLTALELNQQIEGDPEVDRDLDAHQHALAVDRDDLVLESRLAGWMAGTHADLRVWLDAPFEVRIARIADREDASIEAVRETTRDRAASEALRYREFYGIDIEDLSIYDLVVDTARWSAEVVSTIVHETAENRKSDAVDPRPRTASEAGIDVADRLFDED